VNIAGWNRARAVRLPLVTQPGVDDGLGHLRTAGIACAEKEYLFSGHDASRCLLDQ
jgi:hypothetical protein